MNELSARLRHRIAALRPDWNPAEISGFLYLEGGYSNDNYRFAYQGERYVLRAPFRSRPEVDRHGELDVYEAPAGGIAPELVAYDAESGDMITRWVPGRLLADADSGGEALSEYLIRLHGQLPAMTTDYDPLAHARGHLERADPPRWLSRLAATLTWAPEAPVTCHNDLNPWNVIHTPAGAWVTLDWEWVGRNDPLFDLVTLHQGARLGDPELAAMARRYLGEEPSTGRLQRCLTVFWLRETAWAMAEAASGNTRPEVLAQRTLGLERLTRLTGDKD
jgi:aminoglycoside phosphotransferase (APT) family kinase protein